MTVEICPICREWEPEIDFETRCCHLYHFDCLKLACERYEEPTCPYCMQKISLCRAVERILRKPLQLEQKMAALAINYSNEELIDIVDYSAKIGDLDLLKLAISFGADMNHQYHSPVIKTADYGRLHMIEYLLENETVTQETKDFALHSGAWCGHLDIVKYLLENGADIHSDNDRALRLCVDKGHIEIFRFLLDHGADIHIYDEYVLRSSVELQHREIVKLAIEYGANIHVKMIMH